MGSLARAHNKALILKALREGGVMNVTEIAQASGLSTSTTRRWVGSLVIERRVERLAGPGYPQYRLADDGPRQAAERNRRRKNAHSVRPGSQYE